MPEVYLARLWHATLRDIAMVSLITPFPAEAMCRE